MLISVVTDGSELSNYSVGKMLNSAAKNWDVNVLIFFITTSVGKGLKESKKRLIDKAKEMDVKVTIEVVEADGASVAQKICEKAESNGATGIFVPESLPLLIDELKRKGCDIPVEEVSSDLFPTILDLMTKRIVTIEMDDTLKDAADIMVNKRIGSAIVTDDGKVVGILTEHDFVKAFTTGDGNGKLVKDIMSRPVISIDRTGSIFEACELMKKNQIKKLVVMEEGKLLGVITTTDLAEIPLGISESLNYLVSNIKKLSF
jgi:CBS domain-containing protein